jgi:hypothetical protein
MADHPPSYLLGRWPQVAAIGGLLAAKLEGAPFLLAPDEEVPPGTVVS